MTSADGVSHACYACQWNGLGFPCRTNGRPDPLAIARNRIGHLSQEPPLEGVPRPGGNLATASDEDVALPEDWAWECMYAMRDAELAWQVILECVRLVETPWQAGVIAASHVEDFVFGCGEAFLDRIEAEAHRSPRFRFVLTGVWLHDFDLFDPDQPVRRRIERLQAMGPDMNANDPLPPA